MKKESTKKLNLGKVKIASLQGTKKGQAESGSAVCTQNASHVLSICSIDSCRY